MNEIIKAVAIAIRDEVYRKGGSEGFGTEDWEDVARAALAAAAIEPRGEWRDPKRFGDRDSRS